MEQQRGFSQREYAGKKKVARRDRFLGEMETVVPWEIIQSARSTRNFTCTSGPPGEAAVPGTGGGRNMGERGGVRRGSATMRPAELPGRPVPKPTPNCQNGISLIQINEDLGVPANCV